MEKVIRDGLVAVLYSPGYGAGWYSWNKEHLEIVFDPNIVEYVEKQEQDKLLAYMGLKYPDIYLGSNLDRLAISWIEEGVYFRIDEYDGNESVVIKDDEDWIIA
jgi:hypothetical protein